MNLFKQISAVTLMNFKSLPHRIGTSIVIVIGIAGVVGVLVSVLAMSTGMLATMEHSGRDDRAIVLRNGSASEMGSALARDAAKLVEDAPGIKRGSDGKPIVSPEALRLVNLFRKEDGVEVNVALRGVGPQLHAVRPELKIVEGRMFQPAVTEVIVGKAAHSEFKGLSVGDKIKTRGATWTVVGVFTTGGDSHESSLITDAETLIAAEQRGSYQSVTVRRSPSS
jgi:putative ABC transport system permease protein